MLPNTCGKLEANSSINSIFRVELRLSPAHLFTYLFILIIYTVLSCFLNPPHFQNKLKEIKITSHIHIRSFNCNINVWRTFKISCNLSQSSRSGCLSVIQQTFYSLGKHANPIHTFKHKTLSYQMISNANWELLIISELKKKKSELLITCNSCIW